MRVVTRREEGFDFNYVGAFDWVNLCKRACLTAIPRLGLQVMQQRKKDGNDINGIHPL